jgi:hypothetical protein
VTVEYHWAEGQYDRLPELAANLVRRQVAVIATGTPVAALATKGAAKSIPIVFARYGGGFGLVGIFPTLSSALHGNSRARKSHHDMAVTPSRASSAS